MAKRTQEISITPASLFAVLAKTRGYLVLAFAGLNTAAGRAAFTVMTHSDNDGSVPPVPVPSEAAIELLDDGTWRATMQVPVEAQHARAAGMRRYTTEDRSVLAEAAASRIEGQTLQDLEHLTDFTAQEFDDIADMAVGAEKTVSDGDIWIRRTA